VSSAASAASAASVDRIEIDTGLIHVGAFRCPLWHAEFHAHLPTRGYCFVFPRHAVWIHQDGRDPFVADANVVPLYNPTRPYRRRAIGGRPDHTDWFGVAPDLLREMVGAFEPRVADSAPELFTKPCAAASAELYLQQRLVFNAIRSGTADALSVEERGIALLAQVLEAAYGRRLPSLQPTPQHRRLAEHARATVARATEEPLSLAQLARVLSVSPFHLCRVFRSHTGVTIGQYRGHLRLRRALEMLVDEERDVLDVAVALGYSSHSHFTRAFRAAFGMTPSAFRDGGRTTRARMY
jgi:AraC family transcriptional regulator